MTQIIGTAGPACSDDVIRQIIDAGMDTVRVNFSHGLLEDHLKVVETVRSIAKSMGKYVPILADFPSIKIRIGEIDGVRLLKEGQDFTFTTEKVIGSGTRVSVSFDFFKYVKKGDCIYINDGTIKCLIKKVRDKELTCKILTGGNINSRKGINIPGIDLHTDVFTEFDKECLMFCKKHNIESICQSFVNTATDIQDVLDFCDEIDYHPIVIAKVERPGAVKNIDSIIEMSDSIMLGRGDLGVEIEIEKIGLVQKHVVKKTKQANKSVIIATQLLSSMVHNLRPLRSEVTDITNAVFDGASAVMLSNETAVGDHPVECIKTIRKIMDYAQASDLFLDEL